MSFVGYVPNIRPWPSHLAAADIAKRANAIDEMTEDIYRDFLRKEFDLPPAEIDAAVARIWEEASKQ